MVIVSPFDSGEGAAGKRREFCRPLGKNRITVEFGPLENSVIAVGLQILENLPGLIPSDFFAGALAIKCLFLHCDPPSDQNDVIIRQPEEVADVYAVTLHRDIQSFLQFCQSSCILARDDCAVANVVDHIVEVQGI